MEELQSKHKKELKALEGEERAAIKKVKSSKGKKAKDEIPLLEKEYEQKRIELQKTHQQEINEYLQQNQGTAVLTNDDTVNEIQEKVVSFQINNDDATTTTNGQQQQQQQQPGNNEAENTAAAIAAKKKQKKLEKLTKKKQEQKLKEEQIATEMANAPSLRQNELDVINQQLVPFQFHISDITADGNCLYRAIASQLNRIDPTTEYSYKDIRSICADALLKNEAEFAPFCEIHDQLHQDDETEGPTSFQDYANNVRNNDSCWGGHVEIRALSLVLQRPIYIYSVSSGGQPLIIDSVTDNNTNNDPIEPIRLSYHLHYYALGEHYNEVVPNI